MPGSQNGIGPLKLHGVEDGGVLGVGKVGGLGRRNRFFQLLDHSGVLIVAGAVNRIISGKFAACRFILVERPLLKQGVRALRGPGGFDHVDPSNGLLAMFSGFFAEVHRYLTGVVSKIEEIGIRTFVALILDLHIFENVSLKLVEINILDQSIHTVMRG